MSIDRVTQLEQALAAAREMIADLQRTHELAEQAWANQYARQQARLDWLAARLSTDVVARSRRVV